MIFKQGATIDSADDKQVGKLRRVVLDPRTQTVSHIIVEQGLLFPEDRVVPINLVESALEEHIRLRLNAEELKGLPEFVETNYIQVPEEERIVSAAGQAAPFYPIAPMPTWKPGTPVSDRDIEPMIEEQERHIPDESVAVQKGADVLALNDEKVGEIEEVLTDPNSHQITQFVIAKGLVLKEEKRVPIEWVSEIHEDEIRLAVGPKILEYLPAIQ